MVPHERAKRECGEATLQALPIPQLPPQLGVGSLVRMCHWRPFAAGKAGRGDDPRARRPAVGRVDATNIGRGVSVDDPKDESLLVLARAGDCGRSGEVFFVLNFLKSAVDDASA